ncbi:hypothetical protein [Scytonema sp. PRP1]|uniref:hypothetical protein n=1 Tax=Scytonema sp. PRP1 TaxID=3120513 RepID=UPI002FD4A138
MNNIFWRHTSTLLALTSVTLVGMMPVRAENTTNTTISSDNSDNVVQKQENSSETPGTTLTSASALLTAPTSQIEQTSTATTPQTESTQVAQVVSPGRTTRSGPSYIGVGGNIGLTGNTTLSEGAFTVISKIGLTRNLSARPAAVIGDNTVFLIPLTVDFPQENLEVTQLNIAPYIGGGVAVSTGRDSTVGALISGGVDVPLSPQITATGGVNVSFIDETDVGVLVGVGYNF